MSMLNRDPKGRLGRWIFAAAGAFVLLMGGVIACEAMGWPFLAAPLQRWLSSALDRRVVLASDAQTQPDVRIRFFGSLRLDAAHIEIGAPAWSKAPHTVLARDAHLKLRYGDLWRAYRGAPLRIAELEAVSLDTQLERVADGRASWQFGKAPSAAASDAAPRVPTFEKLQVDQGTLSLRDQPLAMNMDARFSLLERERRTPAGAASAPPSRPASASASASTSASTAAAAAASVPAGLQFHGKGQYRQLPLTVDVVTAGVLPVIGEGAATVALPIDLTAQIGRARLTFRGTATDALNRGDLSGRFSLQGPSMADVGEPVGVTLPTTGAFRAQGMVARKGVVWNTVLEQIDVGSSRLNGAFTFDPTPRIPLLSGRLKGPRLALLDLGPAVGAPVRNTSAQRAASKSKSAAPKPAATARSSSKPGRVLPDRPLDLPSLRAMDANVLVDIDNLDLGTSFLDPLKPLRTHLVLADGVLSLRDLDARTGQGRLNGNVQLDGRKAQALWTADLRWDGVRLERWINQARNANAPPYLTGSLNGQARVEGQGRSTAAILGSLRGGIRMRLVNGSVSHLAVEAAGLDVAQALGVMIKGDDSLPVLCTAADLAVENGVLKPKVMVLDTDDSTLWVDGSLSLATETLDLRLLVSPKDFSPLALRTPVRVKGSFADPAVSLEKGKLVERLGAAALLSLLNPVAAILPFFDIGDTDDAKRGGANCRALSQRITANPRLVAPSKSKVGNVRAPASRPLTGGR